MNPFTLFNKTRPLDGLYIIFITNQMQVLFYILVLPMYLVHPYMIFIMIAIGMLSQLNLVILSKFLKAHPAARGYEGFAELFGERKLRFFVLIGLLQLSVKIMIMVVSYAESVRHFIFPAININWLVLFIILIGGYTASRGMENTMRFVIIAFMSSFWIVFLFIRFYVPPIASLNDLYPLIPFEWTRQSWKALLVTWSAFSSPEYLICLAPWFSKHTKVLKCLTIVYEKASQGEMSIVNLHHFKNQLYTHFSDPYAPVFQTDGYHFKYEGTALFQDDKLANVISGIDDQTFQIINNNRYLKYLPLPGHSIVLGQARSAVYFELNEKDGVNNECQR
ncbi:MULTISPECIES: hypothetical protein [Bacillus]|uniref:hypothetical protein n=1 Tax=Bacillus TaxID=1386 RepID=UPI00281527AE|nr:hypothetical protein [Bacillus glycinifermentans]